MTQQFFRNFEFIAHYHLFYFLKHKLKPSQHDFRKHNSTSTNLAPGANTLLNFVSAQGQTD
jgi:hypothetical protein